MTTKKKILTALALVVCAVLLVVGSVAGTLAYLQDSKVVTNTFTVGNVSITLDEAKVDVYGEKDGDSRVLENSYKLIPGHTYVKDPTIHLAAGSEACYLFVKVENGIAGAEATTNTISNQLGNNKWVALQNATNAAGVYVYTNNESVATDKSIVASSNATQDFPVIETIAVSDTADLSSYNGSKVVVTAYAVQAYGFANAAAAWNATFGATVSGGNS
jgi:predicted ribosomally synthesized peptide with SipW-like signal peptide